MTEAKTQKSKAVAKPTRFFVLESDEHLTAWRFVGSREARDRDHALRLFYGKTPPPFCVAVSENAWKPRTPKVETVVTGLTTVAMPSEPQKPEAVQEPDWPQPQRLTDTLNPEALPV
jgi:hypothetical protein